MKTLSTIFLFFFSLSTFGNMSGLPVMMIGGVQMPKATPTVKYFIGKLEAIDEKGGGSFKLILTCSGAKIGEQRVITAGHCLTRLKADDANFAFVFHPGSEEKGRLYVIDKFYYHKDVSRNGNDYEVDLGYFDLYKDLEGNPLDTRIPKASFDFKTWDKIKNEVKRVVLTGAGNMGAEDNDVLEFIKSKKVKKSRFRQTEHFALKFTPSWDKLDEKWELSLGAYLSVRFNKEKEGELRNGDSGGGVYRKLDDELKLIGVFTHIMGPKSDSPSFAFTHFGYLTNTLIERAKEELKTGTKAAALDVFDKNFQFLYDQSPAYQAFKKSLADK